MSACLFCRIVKGEIPAKKVYEDADTLVFADISPQAPVHLLAVPKQHYASIHEIPADKMDILAKLFAAVGAVAAQQELEAKGGYRLVINSGEHAGQAVPHIHVHILSGRPMAWPPG
jgi:histidine triad (HIT) family protein